MNQKVKMTTLLDTQDKEDLMINLLKLNIDSKLIENENWHSAPYGGYNFVEDVLFQTKLTIKCLWDDFFIKNGIDYKNNKIRLQKQMENLYQLRPDLKSNTQLEQEVNT
jgi:hypothetical protein